MKTKIQSIDDILSDLDFDHYKLHSANNVETLLICIQLQRNQILEMQREIAAESLALLSEQLKLLKGE